MRISELPLTTNPTSTDDLPIDRSGVTYRVKYEALRGPKGDPGENGTIENLSAAATTLAPGSQATASYENNLLTLGIPQGAKGDPGDDGRDGVGIPSGGTTGQVLKKASATDYDTEWGNATGGTWGSITGTLSNQTDLQTALNAKADTSAIPTKVSDLTNDAGYLVASSLLAQDVTSQYTITKTSGNLTITDFTVYKAGGFIYVRTEGPSSAVTNSSDNVFVGTISGPYMPKIMCNGLATYYGSCVVSFYVEEDGRITYRAGGGSPYGAGTNLKQGFWFIC